MNVNQDGFCRILSSTESVLFKIEGITTALPSVLRGLQNKVSILKISQSVLFFLCANGKPCDLFECVKMSA